MNTNLIALLCLVCCLQVCLGDETKQSGKNRGETLAIETNSELVSSGGNVAAVHTQSASQCTKDGSMCLTCKSVGMCKGGVLMEVPCRGLYPYCDARTGSCTSERKRCKEEEKPMVCPGKGYFPDPQSCRAFHVCEGDPVMSYKFACASLQVYDPEEKKCTRPSFRVRCVSFSCFGKQGRYTPYPSDRSIYTLCADAAATELFKCPENEEFDETKQKCVPSCKSEDNMADKEDETCRKYYRCVKSGQKFDAVPSTCPAQRIFDQVQLKCVAKPSNFKCPNVKQQSISGTPSTSTTTESAQKEDTIGETEETFFRQNPSQKDNTGHNGKSASIIGSVLHKEVENYQSPHSKVTKDSSSVDTQTAVTEEKKTSQPVHVMHGIISTAHHPTKQIVVRETNTDRTSTSQPDQVTDEHKTSSPHHQLQMISNTEQSVKPTVSTLNGQTYKLTSEFQSTTESLTKQSSVPIKLMMNQDEMPVQEFNVNINNEKLIPEHQAVVSSPSLQPTSAQSTDKSSRLATPAPKPNSKPILL